MPLNDWSGLASDERVEDYVAFAAEKDGQIAGYTVMYVSGDHFEAQSSVVANREFPKVKGNFFRNRRFRSYYRSRREQERRKGGGTCRYRRGSAFGGSAAGDKREGQGRKKKRGNIGAEGSQTDFRDESKLSSHHLLHRGVLRLAGGKPFPSYFQRYFRFPPSAASVFSRVWIRDFRAFFRLRYADGNAHFQKAHSSQAQQMVSCPAPFDLLRKRLRPDFFRRNGLRASL